MCVHDGCCRRVGCVDSSAPGAVRVPGVGSRSAPSVTFEVESKQYLAVGAGGRIAQTQFYARLTDTDVPPGSGVVRVFALP